MPMNPAQLDARLKAIEDAGGGGGGGPDLSDANPEELGTESPGVSDDASRADHVHAHGDQAGGTLHDDATNLAAGFMSSAKFNEVEANTADIATLSTAVTALLAIDHPAATAGAFGNSPNDNGVSIDAATQVVTQQPADATHPGSVSLGVQWLGSGMKGADAIQVGDDDPGDSDVEAGAVALFAQPRGGYPQLYHRQKGVSPIPVGLSHERLRAWYRGVDAVGIAISNNGAAAGAPTYGNGSVLEGYSPRNNHPSNGTAGSSAGYRHGVATICRGTAPNIGGFHIVARLGLDRIPATRRFFWGLRNTTTTIGNVEPSSLTSMIGVGCDLADTNIQVMHNDGSGSAVKVDTGIAAPTTGDLYEVHLFCLPGGSVWVSVENLGTGAYFEHECTSDLTGAGTLCGWHAWANNGSTAAIISVSHAGLQLFDSW